ncbi:hypothetical protein ABW19_dt0207758 [Dactylella cylindrospora]|nr:hypothetical protein ABW19_dt0207758 [Dactylella cylindrospora]
MYMGNTCVAGGLIPGSENEWHEDSDRAGLSEGPEIHEAVGGSLLALFSSHAFLYFCILCSLAVGGRFRDGFGITISGRYKIGQIGRWPWASTCTTSESTKRQEFLISNLC